MRVQVLNSRMITENLRKQIGEDYENVCADAALQISDHYFSMFKLLDRSLELWRQTPEGSERCTDPEIVVACLEALGWEID